MRLWRPVALESPSIDLEVVTLRMLRWVGLVLLAMTIQLATVHVQDEPLEVRLQQVARITPDAAQAFFDTLRRTVGRDERAATCGAIAYPLQHAAGTIKDVADCVARYDSIFTMAVRKAIGTQQFEDVFVNESGVMIGMGEVWFAGRCSASPCREPGDLHISAINSDTAGLRPPKGKVLLACVVSGQRIRVSADGSGGAEFRMWRVPRRSGPPDLEMLHPERPAAPPTQCGSRSWTFTDGTRTYVVSDLPCDAYLSPPPMGSVGRVTLSTSGAPGVPLWCFE